MQNSYYAQSVLPDLPGIGLEGFEGLGWSWSPATVRAHILTSFLHLCSAVFISRSQNKDVCPGKVLPYLPPYGPCSSHILGFFPLLFSSLLPFANVPPLLGREPSTACASAGKNPDETLALLKSQLKFFCASGQQRFQPQLLRHAVTSCCFLPWPERAVLKEWVRSSRGGGRLFLPDPWCHCSWKVCWEWAEEMWWVPLRQQNPIWGAQGFFFPCDALKARDNTMSNWSYLIPPAHGISGAF